MKMGMMIRYRGGEYIIFAASHRMLFSYIWRAWRQANLAPWQITRVATRPAALMTETER